MIFGRGNVYREISKFQSEFTTSPKLIILPSFYIVIHTHSRIKLCNHIVVVSIRKVFISRSSSLGSMVVNVVPPFYFEFKCSARSQRCCKIDTHHGLINCVGQIRTIYIGNSFNFKTSIESFRRKTSIEPTFT